MYITDHMGNKLPMEDQRPPIEPPNPVGINPPNQFLDNEPDRKIGQSQSDTGFLNIPYNLKPDMYSHNQLLIPQNPNMDNHHIPRQIDLMKHYDEYQTLDKKLENSSSGVLVKQRFDIMEALTGCQRENVYHVYRLNQDLSKGKRIFKFKEKSGYCARHCCHGSCKFYDMNCISEQWNTSENQVCMRAVKEAACNGCCDCNRQQLKVKLVEDGEERFQGKCFDPCSCCEYTYTLLDDIGMVDFTVSTSCCQTYFWCRCPCSSCRELVFEIFQGKDRSKVIGKLTRQGKSKVSNALVGGCDKDAFQVQFPVESNWRQRALFMNLAVFIDYSQFEYSNDKQGRKPALESMLTE